MIGIGESVYDIIFKDGQPIAARAGGSMLNTCVSLGRAGRKPTLISSIGQDKVGQLILDFLAKNLVDCKHIFQAENKKTAVSLAFLNEKGDSQYFFYKEHSASLKDMPALPELKKHDIFLFGSIFSVEEQNRAVLIHLLQEAHKKEVLCLYDPNIRKPHAKEMPAYRDHILENIRHADIIRASNEDLQTAFGVQNIEQASDLIHPHEKVLIYTCNANGLWLLANDTKLFLQVPKIKVLSSIGAGDAFNAGLIYAFEKRGIEKGDLQYLHEDIWKEILQTAISFAQNVCLSYDNYISNDFARDLK